MKLKRNELTILIAVVIGLLILLLPREINKKTAEIRWESKTTTVSMKKTYTLYTLKSLFGDDEDSVPDMTFEVSEHGIRVIHSDCPGNDCVHQGYAHNNNGVIVCVPNRVTVRLLDEEPLFDAVV
jgi:hypothetical protein